MHGLLFALAAAATLQGIGEPAIVIEFQASDGSPLTIENYSVSRLLAAGDRKGEHVELTDYHKGRLSVWETPDGIYRIELAPSNKSDPEIVLEIEHVGRTSETVRLRPVDVRGRVVEAKGGVLGAPIVLRSEPIAVSESIRAWSVMRTETGDDGVFRFASALPGEYRLTCGGFSPSFAWSGPKSINGVLF